jgi:hypothetical protein
MKLSLAAAVALATALPCAPALAQQAAAAPTAAPDSFWSRVTVEVPAYTHHIPHDELFNDHNWGAIVDVALNERWSVVGGDFKNSYRRNTAFAAVSWEPLVFTPGALRLAAGGMVGVDLNRGYRGFNTVEPLLGAFNLRVTAADLHDPDPLHRFGLLFTVIPPGVQHGSTAINVAVTYRLR